jgi:hypothetical protein
MIAAGRELYFFASTGNSTMPFIDWSDPDEMLGLLAEYVADEAVAERDPLRRTFLDELSMTLATLASSSEDRPARQTIDSLRDIHDSQPREFGADSVLVHVDECMQELERIVAQREAATG